MLIEIENENIQSFHSRLISNLSIFNLFFGEVYFKSELCEWVGE